MNGRVSIFDGYPAFEMRESLRLWTPAAKRAVTAKSSCCVACAMCCADTLVTVLFVCVLGAARWQSPAGLAHLYSLCWPAPCTAAAASRTCEWRMPAQQDYDAVLVFHNREVMPDIAENGSTGIEMRSDAFFFAPAELCAVTARNKHFVQDQKPSLTTHACR